MALERLLRNVLLTVGLATIIGCEQPEIHYPQKLERAVKRIYLDRDSRLLAKVLFQAEYSLELSAEDTRKAVEISCRPLLDALKNNDYHVRAAVKEYFQNHHDKRYKDSAADLAEHVYDGFLRLRSQGKPLIKKPVAIGSLTSYNLLDDYTKRPIGKKFSFIKEFDGYKINIISRSPTTSSEFIEKGFAKRKDGCPISNYTIRTLGIDSGKEIFDLIMIDINKDKVNPVPFVKVRPTKRPIPTRRLTGSSAKTGNESWLYSSKHMTEMTNYYKDLPKANWWGRYAPDKLEMLMGAKNNEFYYRQTIAYYDNQPLPHYKSIAVQMRADLKAGRVQFMNKPFTLDEYKTWESLAERGLIWRQLLHGVRNRRKIKRWFGIK